MNSLSIRGAEAFASPLTGTLRAVDNETAERLPDNEAAEVSATKLSTLAPLRTGEGSLLDMQA